MKLAFLQTELVWEDPAANRKAISDAFLALEAIDLLVLPEMFSTGFSMRASALAETMTGETLNWMAETARTHKVTLCGSLIISSAQGYTNRLVWMSPTGDFQYYDKRHLFRMSGEHEHYCSGDLPITTRLKGFNCRPLICYDLRFPVYARNTSNAYDVLIFVANWPAARSHHWKTLLAARAIENQCYVIGVNRLGQDGNGVVYSGDSCVIDYSGAFLLNAEARPGLHYVEIDADALTGYRADFPAWMDQDPFEILE